MKQTMIALLSTVIVFWNVENLFDSRAESSNPSEQSFSAGGSRHWTSTRVQRKCLGLAKVLMAIADDYGSLPDAIGLCEVENERVLKTLLYGTPLSSLGYRYVHRDSGDPRGIDCALLYRESTLGRPQVNTVSFPGTRDLLVCRFDSLCVIVCHLPSKLGKGGSELRRAHILARIGSLADSLCRAGAVSGGAAYSEAAPFSEGSPLSESAPFFEASPDQGGAAAFGAAPDQGGTAAFLEATPGPDSVGAPDQSLETGSAGTPGQSPETGRYVVVAGGDFNEPHSALSDSLLYPLKEVEPGSYPAHDSYTAPDSYTGHGHSSRRTLGKSYDAGRPTRQVPGTIKFSGVWETIDRCAVSGANGVLSVYPHPLLLEEDRKHGGVKPRRTYIGPRYNAGLSDHLPIVLVL